MPPDYGTVYFFKINLEENYSTSRTDNTLGHSCSDVVGVLETVKPATTVNIQYFFRVNEHVLGRFIKGVVTAQYFFNLEGREYSGESQSNSYTLTVEEISE